MSPTETYDGHIQLITHSHTNSTVSRNEKHMAPTGSLVHIPSLVFPALDGISLGSCIFAEFRIYIPFVDTVCICTFHRHFISHFDDSIFPYWAHIRSQWRCGEPDRVQRIENAETRCCAGVICSARREGAD